jgi:hypothetical protein
MATVGGPTVHSACLQKCEESCFEELFGFACPKFVVISPISLDDPSASYSPAQEAYRQQASPALPTAECSPSVRCASTRS